MSNRQPLELEAKENKGAQPESAGRSEKRLARGLEDVMHLLLTPSSGKPVEKEAKPNAPIEQAFPDPALSKPHILLQASTAIDRESLLSHLKDNPAGLEHGMKTIDADVPCAPFGSMDLIVADRMNRICIVNVDTFQSDLSILRGIAQVDWVARNKPIVKRMYEKQLLDLNLAPHLFLVAPGFSPLLKCVAQRIVFPAVHCFGYRAVSVKETVGIVFERVK